MKLRWFVPLIMLLPGQIKASQPEVEGHRHRLPGSCRMALQVWTRLYGALPA